MAQINVYDTRYVRTRDPRKEEKGWLRTQCVVRTRAREGGGDRAHYERECAALEELAVQFHHCDTKAVAARSVYRVRTTGSVGRCMYDVRSGWVKGIPKKQTSCVLVTEARGPKKLKIFRT